MLKIGSGKKEITCLIPGLGMMGYGNPANTIYEIGTPLWSRAFVIGQNNKIFIFVNIELCFVSFIIKENVLTKLQILKPELNLTEAEILITAQHTHSGPGGFTQYPFYNMTTPGYRPRVVEVISNGIVESILEALANQEESILSLESSSFSHEQDVAFNRSMPAFNNNQEVKDGQKLKNFEAIDREMVGLRFITKENKLKGLITWFGVHGTSISSHNHRLHADNKGIAASLWEKKHPDAIGIFAQQAAGDVSPNYIWDKKLKRNRGKFVDQYENANYNGELQCKGAESLQKIFEVKGELKSAHLFINMSELAAGPAMGRSFYEGTKEDDASFPRFLLGPFTYLARKVKEKHLQDGGAEEFRKFYSEQGNKIIFTDVAHNVMFGFTLDMWRKIPMIPDPAAQEFIREIKAGGMDNPHWMPHILPVQLIQIGPLVMAGVPGEITYMAGERLKKKLLSDLESCGVKKIVLSSYANAYMGYITTPEEYDIQCYEGGHTLYGRNTLTAIIKGFEVLAGNLKEQKKNEGMNVKGQAFPFSEKDLLARTID